MQSTELTQRIQHLRRRLPQNPVRALEFLPTIPSSDERRRLVILIAQSWARKDINTAWNTVARSSLSTAEKQLMFNELWG